MDRIPDGRSASPFILRPTIDSAMRFHDSETGVHLLYLRLPEAAHILHATDGGLRTCHCGQKSGLAWLIFCSVCAGARTELTRDPASIQWPAQLYLPYSCRRVSKRGFTEGGKGSILQFIDCRCSCTRSQSWRWLALMPSWKLKGSARTQGPMLCKQSSRFKGSGPSGTLNRLPRVHSSSSPALGVDHDHQMRDNAGATPSPRVRNACAYIAEPARATFVPRHSRKGIREKTLEVHAFCQDLAPVVPSRLRDSLQCCDRCLQAQLLCPVVIGAFFSGRTYEVLASSADFQPVGM